MNAEDEKSKKLREIQERLAEIQGKSDKSEATVGKSTASISTPKPASASIQKQGSESSPAKNEPTAAKNEPEPSKPIAPKTAKPAIKRDPTPLEKATYSPPIEKKQETKASTSTSAGWSQNKVTSFKNEEKPAPVTKKASPPAKKDKKPSSKNRTSKILSIISLAITLSVAGYIVYSYAFSNKDLDATSIEAEIPVVVEDQVKQEKIIEENSEVSTEDVSISSNVSKANEAESKATEKRVNEKRIERQKNIDVANQPEAKPEPTIDKSPVPGGFIISYASNGNREAAANNVRILRSKGFSANYYYMRDKDKNAPSLYKVYLGPYSNESEAFPDFKKIIKLNEKAFILNMN